MDFLPHARANFVPVHAGQARQLALPFRRHRFPYLTFWPQRDFHSRARKRKSLPVSCCTHLSCARERRTASKLVSNLSLLGSIEWKNLSTFSNSRSPIIGFVGHKLLNIVESISCINHPIVLATVMVSCLLRIQVGLL